MRTSPIVLLILFAGPGVRAQSRQSNEDVDTPGLTIEAIAGWDGVVDRSVPVPLSFLIRNDSEQIIEGRLRLTDAWSGREIVLGEVVVAPGTERQFTSIQALTDWYECFATLSDGRQVLWRRELTLSTGSEFDASINFALFIDDSGRELRLPGAASRSGAASTSNPVIGSQQGRPVRCLAVKPWQVPDHPGPLIPARAIIFAEGPEVVELNYAQWQAVAEWMCEGGAVFVHAESREIIDRLIETAPLDVEPAAAREGILVSRAGLGAIYEYDEPLFASGDYESRQRIAETLASLSGDHVSMLVDRVYPHNMRGGRADLNRILVVAFFLIYAFLSGVMAMLLFRLTRQRIAAYTVVIVVGASVLSGLLGGFLRFSPGDLRWITVTEAGAGGAVQVGRIEVQSAGGRNTQVAISGEQADLQFIGGDLGYYRWRMPEQKFPPFTWQPDLATDAKETYQINVPITPWGRRRCHATSFERGFPRLEFELAYEPRTSEQLVGMPAGVLTLKLVNHLPVDIRDGWLVIGVTGTPPADSITTGYETWQYQGGASVAIATSEDGHSDVYQTRRLRPLAAGESLEDTFPAQFQVRRNNWGDMDIEWLAGVFTPPRIAHLGAASAWIIVVLEESPGMTIDGQYSDFVPFEGLHVFIQEIHPEDMPDAALFSGTVNEPAD